MKFFFTKLRHVFLIYSSICKNIFLKAGFAVEIVLKTRSQFSLTDTGMGELTGRTDLYDRMTESIFEIDNTNDTEYEPIEFEIIRNMINQPLYNLDKRLLNMNPEERTAYNKNLILKLLITLKKVFLKII